MTYLQVLTELTAQLKRIPEAQAEQTWRDVLTHYNVLPYALKYAPQLMVKQAGESRHRQSSIEACVVGIFIEGADLDYLEIKDIVAVTLQSI